MTDPLEVLYRQLAAERFAPPPRREPLRPERVGLDAAEVHRAALRLVWTEDDEDAA